MGSRFGEMVKCPRQRREGRVGHRTEVRESLQGTQAPRVEQAGKDKENLQQDPQF